MSTFTVDSKKRIILPKGHPGDVFDIQQQADGRFLLVRLEKPPQPKRMTKNACVKAMQESPLRLDMPWDDLRKLTRDL